MPWCEATSFEVDVSFVIFTLRTAFLLAPSRSEINIGLCCKGIPDLFETRWLEHVSANPVG